MITPREAMQILGVTSRTTFWKLIYVQNVPHFRYPGTRIIRFEREAIEALKERSRINGVEDLRRVMNGRTAAARRRRAATK